MSSDPAEPRVFLSHAGADTAAAQAFAALLRVNGLRVWFDKDNLQPGDRWMPALEQAIQQSSAMVVYVGGQGVQHWVDREVRLGLELNTHDAERFKVIPVFGEDADMKHLPPFLSQHQGIRANDPRAIRKLVEALRGVGTPAVPAAYWATHSPFRSLRSFEPDDAWLFFGRDTEISELLDRLEQSRIQVVIGNSGSGKSSLVRAGVIPALFRGRFRVNGNPVERWRIATFRPGNDPFGELVDRLPGQLMPGLPAAERDALITRWRQTFPNGGDAVRNGLAALQTDQCRTLLFADQFEEIFTLVSDDTLRRRYIDGLLNATAADGVHLVIGVRADFYAHCLRHPPLKPFLQGNYSVLLMHPQQLREAVDKRLALTATDAAPGLVDAVIADLGTEPGNLALLEHTLAQLWLPPDGRYTSARLTNERYEEIGRLRGAIGAHAQHVYKALDPCLEPLARKIFLELVHLGEGAPDTRRRVQKDRLLALAVPDVVERLLSQLASERLIATSGDGAELHSPTVEVSHEALIREWATLRQWIDENREELRFGRRLGVDAEDWASSQEGSGLLRGAKLLKAKEWLAQHSEAPRVVRSFVDASETAEADAHAAQLEHERQLRDAAEARELAERERRAQAQQKAQLFRRFVWTMAGLVVAISGLAAYAYQQQRVAESRQLAVEAQELLGRDQSRALNMAMKAWARARTPEAHRAIAAAFPSSPITLAQHTDWVRTAVFSPDGQRIVTASRDGTARIWDARSGQLLAVLQGHTAFVWSAMFSPDGQRIVTASDDHTARVWDARSGQQLAILQEHADRVMSVVFSPDGQQILTASGDGTARVWNAGSGQALAVLQGDAYSLNSAVFSPDGQRIVTASDDRAARVWDARSGQALMILQGHTDRVSSAAFSPDGQWIVTASHDGARLWDARSGQALAILQGHTGLVFSAVFSSDGQRVVTASWDGTARLWDARSGHALAVLQGHTDPVWSAVFSPDGQQILTASRDGTARVWDGRSGEALAVLRRHGQSVSSAVFSPDGHRIVTASADGTACVWNARSGRALAILAHPDSVHTAALSPDGQRIVTASIDGNARLWDVRSGEELAVLHGWIARVGNAIFSPDGERIVIADNDGVRVWHARSGRVLAMLVGHTASVGSAVFSPDGQRIVSASRDATARVWNARTWHVLATLQGHTAVVQTAVFAPDGYRVVTGSEDGTARVWDARSGQLLAVLQGHTGAVLSAVFSPDGQQVVTASGDETARVWDAWTGRGVLTLRGHTQTIWTAVFSPDGQQVVTASNDHTARVWDVRTGECVVTLDHTDGYAFSPDGRAVTTAIDGTARVWAARSGQAVATLQGHTDRVRSARFSPDGQMIVTGSEDRTARVFRIVGLDDLAALFAK
jgi:WD40 repeat protein